jgi:hypothetical protein
MCSSKLQFGGPIPPRPAIYDFVKVNYNTFMDIPDRPTDMLERQLFATREAIRYRNPETGKRNFCHLPHYREIYIKGVKELQKRKRLIHFTNSSL